MGGQAPPGAMGEIRMAHQTVSAFRAAVQVRQERGGALAAPPRRRRALAGHGHGCTAPRTGRARKSGVWRVVSRLWQGWGIPLRVPWFQDRTHTSWVHTTHSHVAFGRVARRVSRRARAHVGRPGQSLPAQGRPCPGYPRHGRGCSTLVRGAGRLPRLALPSSDAGATKPGGRPERYLITSDGMRSGCPPRSAGALPVFNRCSTGAVALPPRAVPRLGWTDSARV